MAERGGQARLADQAFRVERFDSRFEPLERHAAAQLGIPGFEHMAKAAFAQPAADFVVSADRVVLQWGLTGSRAVPYTLASVSTWASNIEKGQCDGGMRKMIDFE